MRGCFTLALVQRMIEVRPGFENRPFRRADRPVDEGALKERACGIGYAPTKTGASKTVVEVFQEAFNIPGIGDRNVDVHPARAGDGFAGFFVPQFA